MNIRTVITNLILIAGLFTAVATAKEQTLTGVVSDNMCGKKHMMKDAPAAKCTRECVKAGSDYALVVGDKVYTLKGDKAQIDKFAAEKATVRGTVERETINVTSIESEK